jgi:hypothetical protein
MAKPTAKRPYQQHGLHVLTRALENVEASRRSAWLDGLGEAGEALRQWRAALVADLGGEEATSAMQRAVLDMAAKTYLFLESVDRFLLTQESLVNKSRRQLFPVVLQRQQLADALARYMGQLGLARRARELPTLASYIARKDDLAPTPISASAQETKDTAGQAPLEREGAGREPQGSPLRRAPLPPHEGEP